MRCADNPIIYERNPTATVIFTVCSFGVAVDIAAGVVVVVADVVVTLIALVAIVRIMRHIIDYYFHCFVTETKT